MAKAKSSGEGADATPKKKTGRPSTVPGANTMSLVLTDRHRKWIKDRADKHWISSSAVIRELLDRAMQKKGV